MKLDLVHGWRQIGRGAAGAAVGNRVNIMSAFFFPIMWWIPDFGDDVVETEEFVFIKRKWDVTIFDIYTLVAERHMIDFPAEIAHVFLRDVNLEVKVKEAEDISEAADRVDVLRTMFYSRGIAATIAPYAADYSINDYAGINSRSSSYLREKLPEELKNGITGKDVKIHMMAHELSLSCMHSLDEKQNRLSRETIAAACDDYKTWRNIERQKRHAIIARMSVVKAPIIPNIEISILQMWQGIEALFPDIHTEVTFRISLLLSQLIRPIKPRLETYAIAKKSYGDRSKIVHGSFAQADAATWLRSWGLICLVIRAIVERRGLPTGEQLVEELLRDIPQQERSSE